MPSRSRSVVNNRDLLAPKEKRSASATPAPRVTPVRASRDARQSPRGTMSPRSPPTFKELKLMEEKARRAEVRSHC